MCFHNQGQCEDEMDIKLNSETDEIGTDLRVISAQIYSSFQRMDEEECKQINFVQIENNNFVSFPPALNLQRNFSSMSDEFSNNAQICNISDNLLFSSHSDARANDAYFNNDASYKVYEENLEIDQGFESILSELYSINSSTTGNNFTENKDESRVFSLPDTATDQEFQIPIEESERHSFIKDLSFVSQDNFPRNEYEDSKNISEISNSHVKYDYSPNSKEPDLVSGTLTSGPISPDVYFGVSNRNNEKDVNVMEIKENLGKEDAVAGPSGIWHGMIKKYEKKFVCGLCYKEFKTSWEFDFHYQKHKEKTPLVSKVCEKKITKKVYFDNPSRTSLYQADLNWHVDKHDKTNAYEKPFACDICKRKFTLKINLVNHYRNHAGEKPFVCEICKKRFTQKIILVNHYRTHTGENPFVCEICKRKFTQKTNLVRHYRTHSGEKSFLCEICKRKFTQKTNLVRHYRTHTGEKSFACEICNAGFNQKVQLVRHFRKHISK